MVLLLLNSSRFIWPLGPRQAQGHLAVNLSKGSWLQPTGSEDSLGFSYNKATLPRFLPHGLLVWHGEYTQARGSRSVWTI